VIDIVKVNQILKLNITDITVDGDGIGKTESGYPLFIKGTVPGDVAMVKVTKVNKTYGFGTAEEIISPSPKRCKPKCPYFEKCGGCTLMHIDYGEQAKIKESHVLSNIKRIGGYEDGSYIYEGIVDNEHIYHYRNKAQFPVGLENGVPVCGFFEKSSHKIVPAKDCIIQNEEINKAVSVVMGFLEKYKVPIYNEEKHKGIVRHICVRHGGNEKNELMVIIVTNSRERLPKSEELTNLLKEKVNLKSLIQNINTKNSNVVMGYENITLYGDDNIRAKIQGIEFIISPNSFFQVNYAQMEKLYQRAKDYALLTGEETVFDLYCGVGSISLFMADKAKKVIGIEIVEAAIENAKKNAALNKADNTEFYCGDCTKITKELISKGKSADVVIVDPPRKGCDENLLELINDISPKRLVYVSCNSATLARDLKILKEKYGYIMTKCSLVDMFAHSGHCEVVCALQRQLHSDINLL
jgi:23S rRNA (uracil1939-C5)-methyltransferase